MFEEEMRILQEYKEAVSAAAKEMMASCRSWNCRQSNEHYRRGRNEHADQKQGFMRKVQI